MKTNVTLNDFETICRTCMCSNNLQSIRDNVILIEILQIITDYNNEDALPKNICDACVLKINEIRSFVLQCKTTDLTLKESLATENNEGRNGDNTPTPIKMETLSDDSHNDFIISDQEQDETCSDALPSSTGERNKELELSKNTFVYKCEACSLEFTDLSKFTRHNKVHRNITKSKKLNRVECHRCDGCELVFTSSKHLSQHKRVHHITNPKHKCEICSKQFVSSSGLKRHQVLHENVHSFKCNICGKAFNFGYNLKVHQRTHTGSKPYKCSECERRFSNSTQLKRHKQLHTDEKPYFCETCLKAFTEPGQLKQHKRTHSGEKPYYCQLCEKGFSFSNSLIRHIRTHTGDKPYKCKICLKKFTDSSNLSRHIKIHL